VSPGFTQPFDLLVLLLVAFMILGPKQLPGVARALGRGIREIKQGLSPLSLLAGDGDTNRDAGADPQSAQANALKERQDGPPQREHDALP
jgi:TatA/E family protein of Tat protein translocase